MTTDTKPNYKSTLNLPKTDFAMKGNLSQNEPLSQKRWEQMKLYEQIIAKRQAEAGGAPPFVFHDGPPYANGSLHIGHLLNKVLKDMVVRSRLMMGMQCKFIPGWDCHGLPIEHKVVTELMESGKFAKLNTLTEDQRRMAIRRESAAYAEKSLKLQMGQMKRMLTLADYEHPYLTMTPEYEKGVLDAFAVLLEQGLVYRALKPVHWSIANQTALAEAELEYEDREDLSIYVDFEAVDRDAVEKAFGVELDQTPSFMIWTTTPWTLPANLAIAVHERFRYALVLVDGNVTVMASDLVAKVTKAAKAEEVQVLAETDGRNLIGLQYRHPFVTGTGTPALRAGSDSDGPASKTRGSENRGTSAGSPALRAGSDSDGSASKPPGSENRGTSAGSPALRAGSNSDDSASKPPGSENQGTSTPGSENRGIWRIVAADYVTLEDGTGLVHTAPGHGTEDYQTGLREKLPIYCPMKGDGTFDDTAPQWLRGVSVWDANEKVVNHLRDSGHLFFAHKFTHSYPHDWRSKTPVIFRATEQWFIGVDKQTKQFGKSLREMGLRATDKEVKFYPEWGRNRLRGMLESRPDWCISRQRAWGLPIPAFYGNEPGQVLLTPASVRAVAKLIAEKGSDVWFQSPSNELLKYYDSKDDPVAPDWVRTRHLSAESEPSNALVKSTDIFDVWFESGTSWNAVIRQREQGYPTDLYLEGSDQHRGWFQSSLLPALGVTGVSPFKSLLTHGFMVDKDGKKMSKSLGNTLNVDDLLKNHGADVCRWWVSSLAFENDIKSDLAFIEAAGETYRKVRNTLRFLLSNLFDFAAGDLQLANRVSLDEISPTSIDGYILQQAAALQKVVQQAYETYEFRRANQLLYDFCNDTLSAFYCAAVKDRLYCDKPDSKRRRITQTVMWDVMELLCCLLAPIMPHTADEAYRALRKNADDSVHLQKITTRNFKADADWSKVLAARDAALKAMEDAKARGIENPLDAEVVLPDPEGVLAKFKADLPDMLGVSRVKLVRDGEISINDLRDEPRCDRSWKRDGTVKQRSDGGRLSDRDAEAVGV